MHSCTDVSKVWPQRTPHPVGFTLCLSVLQEGRSQWSPIQPISTAASLPSCPVGLKLGQTTRSSVSLSWSPPSDDGGSDVQEYEVGSCRQQCCWRGCRLQQWPASQVLVHCAHECHIRCMLAQRTCVPPFCCCVPAGAAAARQQDCCR